MEDNTNKSETIDDKDDIEIIVINFKNRPWITDEDHKRIIAALEYMMKGIQYQDRGIASFKRLTLPMLPEDVREYFEKMR